MGELQETIKRFWREVAEHRLTIEHESGVYRHLRFARPGSYTYAFQITTFPGTLVFTGDMGSLVFQRVHDMLKFFRDEGEVCTPLEINPDYWASKLVASSCYGPSADGVMQFDQDKYEDTIKRDYVEFVRRNLIGDVGNFEETRRIRRSLLEAVREELLTSHNDERDAIVAAMSFRHESGFSLEDFYEHNVRSYTHHFIWACCAIVWGIRRYDLQRAVEDHALNFAECGDVHEVREAA